MDPTVWSNAHGALTHFPIALMLVSAFCDWASQFIRRSDWHLLLRSTASLSVVLGTLGGCAAAVTGLVLTHGQAWGHGALLHHHQFGWSALGLMMALSLWRITLVRNADAELPRVYLVLTVVASVLIGGAGYWGGEMINRAAAFTGAAIPERASSQHGRQLFVQSCSHCHGDDAHGSGEDAEGPDLYSLRIGNARIATVILGGIPDEMPSFAKKHGPQDIADLTAYLRELN